MHPEGVPPALLFTRTYRLLNVKRALNHICRCVRVSIAAARIAESLIRVPGTPSASHRYERQISFRRRGVHQQSRSFDLRGRLTPRQNRAQNCFDCRTVNDPASSPLHRIALESFLLPDGGLAKVTGKTERRGSSLPRRSFSPKRQPSRSALPSYEVCAGIWFAS
jgi:hypothetical protein